MPNILLSPLTQLILGVVVWLLAGSLVAAWVHKDAQRRKMNVVLWATLGFFFHVLGLVIYLIARPRSPKLVCPQCGREMLPSWDSCPFCQTQEQIPSVIKPSPSPSSSSAETPQPAEEGLADTVALQSQQRPAQGQTVKLETKEPVLAWLIVKEGKRVGKEFRLLPDITSIGSDVSNDIVIDDEAVSRQHAKVRIEEGQFMLYDLVSTNGTFVNGEKVTQRELQDGDEVRLGSTLLVFKKI